jgi:hypothetical protein
MKSNLFFVTLRLRSNSTETFYVKGYNINDIIGKIYTYIDSNTNPGVEPASIDKIELIGKILV